MADGDAVHSGSATIVGAVPEGWFGGKRLVAYNPIQPTGQKAFLDRMIDSKGLKNLKFRPRIGQLETSAPSQPCHCHCPPQPAAQAYSSYSTHPRSRHSLQSLRDATRPRPRLGRPGRVASESGYKQGPAVAVAALDASLVARAIGASVCGASAR
eukprot:2167467-Rhodomonas_salina.1